MSDSDNIELSALDQTNFSYRPTPLNSGNNFILVGLSDKISDEENNSWFQRYKSDTSKSFFIIQINNRPCGIIGLKNIDSKAKTAEIFIAIEDKFKNMKIGTKALSKLITYARRNLLLKKLHLTVASENAAAISIYRKAGFEEVSDNLQNETAMVLSL